MLSFILDLTTPASPRTPPSVARSGRTADPTGDAFSIAVAARLSSDIGAQARAASNARAGASLLQVADRGLDAIDVALASMKSLATDAASTAAFTALSGGDRAILNAEFQDLRTEIDRIAADTEFDGIKVLNGTSIAFSVGTGTASQDKITVTLSAATAASLVAGLASDDITSASGASQALTNVKSAIDAVATIRASVTAASVSLQGANRNLASSNKSLTNLRSDLLEPSASLDLAQDLTRSTGQQLLAGVAPTIVGRVSGAMHDLLLSTQLSPLERPQAPDQTVAADETQDQAKANPAPRESGGGYSAKSGPSQTEAPTERS